MRKAKNAIAAVLAFVAAVVYGNTGTVTASLDGGVFNVAFANHAQETNSLWVVYDEFDYGSGTNAWAHVERLGTVTPATNSWTYAAPVGWGETVRAIRFILSEVPYDYDYSLDFIRSKSKERIILDDFDLYLGYRICMQCTVYSLANSNGAFFTNRGGENTTPYFTLFALNGKNWRFDYNGDNGTAQSGVAANVPYNIVASSAGLYVNNAGIASLNGSPSTEKSNGSLEFFWGSTTATYAQNNGHHISLYGVQIYDAPTGGNLLVNLVPMVKNGRGGVYDTVRDVYYFSDTGTDFDLNYGPARIESANPFFASALFMAEATPPTGPSVFTPSSPVTVSQSITNAYGGILDGSATLTLTGENDWGGSFIVSNGTLVAAFGQGLAATDCLRLETSQASSGIYGGYGGWNGCATASLGSGAGQICVTDGNYLAYCAADGGELEVDIGGAGAPVTLTADTRRFILNGISGAGTLRFKNPIILDQEIFILRVGFGTAIFENSIASLGTGKNSRTINCRNVDIPCDGVGIFQGKGNHFRDFNVFGGSYILDSGSTNIIDGDITMQSGVSPSLLATNAMVNLTGDDGGGAWLNVFGGKAEFVGGELLAGGVYVGETNGQSSVVSRQPSLVLRGKVVLTATGTGNDKSFGSFNVRNSARSEALVFEEGADVTMKNLVVHRRNVYHRGGRVELTGGNGLCHFGEVDRARYWLHAGAEFLAPGVFCEKINDKGQFIFMGGKMTTTTQTHTPFFERFGGGESAIMVASKYGGEFCVRHATSVPKGMVEVARGIGAGDDASDWNYAAADWLTAPAFKKSGARKLVMYGTNTYNCATDVAEGTLELAGGETPGALPTNGVVRVTGGTLDLGGNAQKVRALLGTSGAVLNGTLIAKEGIYPGGAGAVGSFTCGAALDGELHVDVDVSTGASDKIVANGTLDPSRIDLVLSGADIGAVQKFRVVEGATTGEFRSVSGLPNGWKIMCKADGLWVRKTVGMAIIYR